MAKRMKRVFTNSDQVIHLWANQSQSDARSRNVFFEGDSVYSYGYHYKLGRIHKVNGITIALINSTRYSNSTSKHQSMANSAVSHLVSLQSSDVDSIETALIESQDRLVNEFFNLFNQRSFWDADLSYYFKNVKEFNEVCDFLKRKELKIEVPEELRKLAISHIKKCIARREVLNVEKTAKREAARLERVAKIGVEVEAWKVGGPLTNGMREIKPQLIRVNNNKVETTMGAEVPLTEAMSLLVRILKGKAKKGDKVGSFTLESVQKDTVTIGCHTISLAAAKQVLDTVK